MSVQIYTGFDEVTLSWPNIVDLDSDSGAVPIDECAVGEIESIRPDTDAVFIPISGLNVVHEPVLELEPLRRPLVAVPR